MLGMMGAGPAANELSRLIEVIKDPDKFSTALDELRALIAEAETARAANEQALADLTRERDELERATALLGDRQVELDQRQADIEAGAVAITAQLDQRQAEVEEAEAEIVTTQQQLDAQRTQQTATARSLRTTANQQTARAAELETRQGQLDRYEESIQAREAEVIRIEQAIRGRAA